MTTTQPPQAPTPEREELARMSFGDHLDELRRRLIISLAALVVCVGGVLPFKKPVTELYIAPYRQMWDMAFEDHLEAWRYRGIDASVPEDQRVPWSGIDAIEDEEERSIAEFLRRNEAAIEAGEYERTSWIDSRGAFSLPYTLKAIGGLEDFWTFMAATVLLGLILALPIVLYQAWSFIAAGLYRHERGVVLRFLPAAIGLFFGGVAFGYFVVVPFALFFLVQLMVSGAVDAMLSVAQYFSLLLTLTAALGVVFQLPLVMLALNKVGLVSHRAFIKNWRYVILSFFVVSALLTPPDPFTQLMMAAPMCLLFGVGLILTWRSERAVGAGAGGGPA